MRINVIQNAILQFKKMLKNLKIKKGLKKIESKQRAVKKIEL